MRAIGKKPKKKKKLNLSLKYIKLVEPGVILIYIKDIYSKTEVHLPQKNHLMYNYFNLNNLKVWQDFVENTWNNYFLIFDQLFNFFFLIFQNQSAGNVIQLIKKKKSLNYRLRTRST